MSVLVTWQGREYDIDPTEMTTRELDRIEQATGLTLSDLVGDLMKTANVARALFWTCDRRTTPDLRFSDYDGPPFKVILAVAGEYYSVVGEAVGKAAASLPVELSDSSGSPHSLSSTPGAALESSTS